MQRKGKDQKEEITKLRLFLFFRVEFLDQLCQKRAPSFFCIHQTTSVAFCVSEDQIDYHACRLINCVPIFVVFPFTHRECTKGISPLPTLFLGRKWVVHSRESKANLCPRDVISTKKEWWRVVLGGGGRLYYGGRG